MKRLTVFNSLVVVCFLMAAATGLSQSINGRVVGTVTDPNGAVVPKASVSLTNEGTGALRNVEADDSGNYVVPELPVGLYTVAITAANFAPANRAHVKVDVGSETRVDVAITVQGAAAEVTIEDQAPVLQRNAAPCRRLLTTGKSNLCRSMDAIFAA